MDDGPGVEPAPDHKSVPDAQPRAEPLRERANRPYVVFGRSYRPMTTLQPFRERGVASWYGRKFHGQKTSSGETYDMYGMTAAHPTLPIPSYARVTHVRSGESVVVRVNDRGPFLHGRVIDLSYTAASKLGYVNAGHAEVDVELLTNLDQFPDTSMTLARNQSARSSAKPTNASQAISALPSVPVPVQVSAQTSTPPQASSQQQASAPPQVLLSDVKPVPLPVPVDATQERLSVDTTVLGVIPPVDGSNRARAAVAPAVPPTAPVPIASVSPVLPGKEAVKAVAPGPAAAVNSTQGSAITRVYLQLGAFASRDGAESVRERVLRNLDGMRHPLEIIADGRLFKLQAGPFVGNHDAGDIAERLRSILGAKPFTVWR